MIEEKSKKSRQEIICLIISCFIIAAFVFCMGFVVEKFVMRAMTCPFSVGRYFIWVSMFIVAAGVAAALGAVKYLSLAINKLVDYLKKVDYSIFIPKMTKKRLVYCILILLIFAFGGEALYTLLRSYDPPPAKYFYNIIGVLKFGLIAIVILYLVLISGIIDKRKQIGTGIINTVKTVPRLKERCLTWGDWIVWIILAAFCFFSMQQSDLYHTVSASFGLLNGHISDFYTYVSGYLSQSSYMITTYIIFALWNLPYRLLFGSSVYYHPTMDLGLGIVWWNKLLIAIFYVATAFILYKTAKAMGCSALKSKICSYLFLACPLSFFGAFCFGQYDILMAFFMALGIYYYVKKSNRAFVISFAIAITFKYTALLFFIPMLLVRYKNIWKILFNLICSLIPYALITLYYIQDPVYLSGVVNFGPVQYVFNPSLSIFPTSVSLYVFLVAFVLICVYAYLKKSEDDDALNKNTMFVGSLVSCLCFGLCMFHPQWLLIAVPMLSLSAINSKHAPVVMALQLIMSVAAMVFAFAFWTQHVDSYMLSRGLFGLFNGNIDTGIVWNAKLIFPSGTDLSLWYTLTSAAMLASVLMCNPKQFADTSDDTSIVKAWGWQRARFLIGMGVVLIPAWICYFYTLLL